MYPVQHRPDRRLERRQNRENTVITAAIKRFDTAVQIGQTKAAINDLTNSIPSAHRVTGVHKAATQQSASTSATHHQRPL